ncbi:hypothetical protein [uncultured Rhodospira sp.]|uniref:hypothetical protein n=1 Tax=uncultured Rhodospira sp. TaxID=1936189 RepID=UPI00261BCE5A|nr:hypothetical protein [uncultured Rhodospira sp.]
MLRFLVFFRYGMAARRHRGMDHVTSESDAFSRRLARATTIAPSIQDLVGKTSGPRQTPPPHTLPAE